MLVLLPPCEAALAALRRAAARLGDVTHDDLLASLNRVERARTLWTTLADGACHRASVTPGRRGNRVIRAWRRTPTGGVERTTWTVALEPFFKHATLAYEQTPVGPHQGGGMGSLAQTVQLVLGADGFLLDSQWFGFTRTACETWAHDLAAATSNG